MKQKKENNGKIEEDRRTVLRGEQALLIVVLINSLGVVLMLQSGSGISAISSVPYAFSLVLPKLSLGTWTYIFQGLLVVSLMILQKRFVPQYLFSFVVGFAFSEMLDVHKLWISGLPMGLGWQLLYFVVSYLLLCFGIALAKTIPLRVLYFVISYLLICIGIALSNRCGLPIIPTDLFPRDLSNIIGAKYSRVKISFDVICLAVTGLMTGLFLGHLDGLGIGTVLAAFTMGKVVGLIGDAMDKKVRFVSVLSK